MLDGGYVIPGGYTGRGPGPNLVTRPKPRPVSTPTRIYEAVFPKMEIWMSSGIGGIRHLTNYTVPTITTIYKYIQKKKTSHLFCDSCIQPIAMPRDEVDISAVTNKPRKRTLSSYVRNQDNISGDRDQYINRIKNTVNPGVFPK